MRGEFKVVVAAVAVVAAAVVFWGAGPREPEYTEYQTTMLSGETLWQKCQKLNHGQEDVRKVISRTVKENNILDVGNIPTGKKLTIRVLK